MPDPIPMIDLAAQFREIEGPVRDAIERVLRSQRFILGEEVDAFESEIVAYTGARHAVACGSGSDALLLAAMALDLKPGDEVLTTPYTFFATAGALWRLGLRPIFCDIELATFNIDPAGLEQHLSSRTRALLPVHLFGQCCHMEKLLDFARIHKLLIIEDAAQSFGDSLSCGNDGNLGRRRLLQFFSVEKPGMFRRRGDGGHGQFRGRRASPLPPGTR